VPFQTVGALIGTNGKFLVTADTTTLFSYAVESNGSIGKLVSTINTQLYSGSECGTMFTTIGPAWGPGEFDHTGANIYISLVNGLDENGNLICDGLQTYGISETGLLTFKGATEYAQDNVNIYDGPTLPTITGNGKFAYGFDQVVLTTYADPSSIPSQLNMAGPGVSIRIRRGIPYTAARSFRMGP
jgi:hypothetical protein